MKRLTVPPGMPDAAHSAWRVALRRAAHQLFDSPIIFADPYAVPLLGTAGTEALRRTPAAQGRIKPRQWSRSLRAFVVARSLYAEACVAATYSAGTRQYCLLGAGLDTFALRNPWPGLRVWELDQPAVGQWKAKLLREAGLYVSWRDSCESIEGDLLDIFSDAFSDALWPPGGMDLRQPALFAMLGVAPFLPPEALRLVLGRIRRFPPGSAIVFDYRLPRAGLGSDEQRQFDSLQKRATAKGEPFSEGWTPEALASVLADYAQVEDLDHAALNARYFAARLDGLAIRGTAARLVLAVV